MFFKHSSSIIILSSRNNVFIKHRVVENMAHNERTDENRQTIFDQKIETKRWKSPFREETIETFEYSYKTHRVTFFIAGLVIILVSKLLWRLKIEGKENIPKNKHCIIMPNHLSHLDSYVASRAFWPTTPIHFIADEKLFKNKYFAWLARNTNVFPVRKRAKQLSVVRYAINLVRHNATLLWYPEGQRHKNPKSNVLNPGKIGSGWIAHQSNVPIIPVFISGTEFAMPVSRSPTWGRGPRTIQLTARYGPAVYLDDLRALPPSKEVSKLVADRIMDAIKDLRPDSYQESY